MTPDPKNWCSGPDVLPEALQHRLVHAAKDKSDHHREAYKIRFYNSYTEVPSDYRQEWREDWEIVDVGFSKRSMLGYAHLTITLVERPDEPPG